MKKRVILFFLIVLISVECYGLKKPNIFFESSEPGWATIELRENLSYEKAWQNVVDILARKFEIAVMSKDGGYIEQIGSIHGGKRGK
jgi:hypothetical protein